MAILIGVSGLAINACARANIEDYLSKGPNDFYPGGHDVNGSPVKQVIDVLGWNATSIIGNLGIGNNSISLFNSTSQMYDVDYPENGFMCGQISTQPWAPGEAGSSNNSPRSAEDNTTTENAEKGNNSSVNGSNPTFTNTPGKADHGNYSESLGRALNTSEQSPEEDLNGSSSDSDYSTENKTGEAGQNDADENQTYAAYHPIRIGKPVKDLLYEHPLATPGTAYCELLGFQTPSGALINVGMKCTCYGY